VLTLLALWLQRAGRIGTEITTEHYHDLGQAHLHVRLLLGLHRGEPVPADLVRESPGRNAFFLPRQIGPWAAVSIALVVCHLAIPLGGLMSRHAKRRLAVFTFWAVWALGAHLLDLFWLIMPNLFANQIPQAVRGRPGTSLPAGAGRAGRLEPAIYQVAQRHVLFLDAVWMPLGARAVATLIALVVGMGGLYLASTAWMLRGASLVPLGDPRLAESLAFENT